MKRAWVGWALVGASGLALWPVMHYVRDMRTAYSRIRGTSQVLSSPLGDIEYSKGGEGPAVLVIHGSGGGFDQGHRGHLSDWWRSRILRTGRRLRAGPPAAGLVRADQLAPHRVA